MHFIILPMRLANPFTTYPFNSLDHSLMLATKTGPQISGSSPSNPRSPRSGSHLSASTMDVPIPWIPTCFWCHYVPLPFFPSFFPFFGQTFLVSLVIDQHPHCIPTIPMVGSPRSEGLTRMRSMRSMRSMHSQRADSGQLQPGK